MSPYLVLMLAIVFEVIGTLLLPVSDHFTKLLPTLTLILSYTLSFYLLSHVTQKLSLAIVYATWSGMGIILISLFGYLIHKQQLSWPVIIGLVLTIVGVVVINLFSEQI